MKLIIRSSLVAVGLPLLYNLVQVKLLDDVIYIMYVLEAKAQKKSKEQARKRGSILSTLTTLHNSSLHGFSDGKQPFSLIKYSIRV